LRLVLAAHRLMSHRLCLLLLMPKKMKIFFINQLLKKTPFLLNIPSETIK
jgi:hypothetical protein